MRWQPFRTVVAIQGAVVLLATPLVLLAARSPFPFLLIGGMSYGAGAAVVNALIATSIQREIPAALLSRVFSIIKVAAGVLAPAGYALAAPASAWLGPRQALAAGAVVSLASAVVLISLADVRRFGAPLR